MKTLIKYLVLVALIIFTTIKAEVVKASKEGVESFDSVKAEKNGETLETVKRKISFFVIYVPGIKEIKVDTPLIAEKNGTYEFQPPQ